MLMRKLQIGSQKTLQSSCWKIQDHIGMTNVCKWENTLDVGLLVIFGFGKTQ